MCPPPFIQHWAQPTCPQIPCLHKGATPCLNNTPKGTTHTRRNETLGAGRVGQSSLCSPVLLLPRGVPRAGAGGPSHSVCPRTVKFGGCGERNAEGSGSRSVTHERAACPGICFFLCVFCWCSLPKQRNGDEVTGP